MQLDRDRSDWKRESGRVDRQRRSQLVPRRQRDRSRPANRVRVRPLPSQQPAGVVVLARSRPSAEPGAGSPAATSRDEPLPGSTSTEGSPPWAHMLNVASGAQLNGGSAVDREGAPRLRVPHSRPFKVYETSRPYRFTEKGLPGVVAAQTRLWRSTRAMTAVPTPEVQGLRDVEPSSTSGKGLHPISEATPPVSTAREIAWSWNVPGGGRCDTRRWIRVAGGAPCTCRSQLLS